MWRDIDKTKKSAKITIKSNKTGNHYYIDLELYHNAVTTEVCKFYKKVDHNWGKKNLTIMSRTELKIDDRIPKFCK